MSFTNREQKILEIVEDAFSLLKDEAVYGISRDSILETEIEMYKNIMKIKDDLTITYDPSKSNTYHQPWPSIPTSGTYVKTPASVEKSPNTITTWATKLAANDDIDDSNKK